MENLILGNFFFIFIGCFGYMVNDKIVCVFVFKCKSVIWMCVYVNVYLFMMWIIVCRGL